LAPKVMNLEGTHPRPALLVSIHDVSPLTIESSRRAVELAVSAGVPLSALTVLLIPRHEDRAPLDEYPLTRDWVRSLVDAGVCPCMHGLTHQMSSQVRNPWQWACARGFARGQGELFMCGVADCERRLEAARAVFRRAGLDADVRGFVPPAWLLSPEALLAVKRAGFTFYERLTGIVYRDIIWARRLIGFGSLTGPEARVTAGYAHLQSRLPPADTRFAIHPADIERSSSVKAIRANLRRLLDHLEPMNYMDFLCRVE
jgi:predicted deacetylase